MAGGDFAVVKCAVCAVVPYVNRGVQIFIAVLADQHMQPLAKCCTVQLASNRECGVQTWSTFSTGEIQRCGCGVAGWKSDVVHWGLGLEVVLGDVVVVGALDKLVPELPEFVAREFPNVGEVAVGAGDNQQSTLRTYTKNIVNRMTIGS